ncbi:transposase zinc-binding domain-containing protein [Klebsiella pneumoniae]
MLACGTPAMGLRRYCCASPHCTHTKYICYSCKGKGCSACGMKATEQWIAEQQHILPDCEWQHITFTMPDKLWPLFANNWPLLNPLFSCAAHILLKWAKKLGVEIGLFVALHTYGRQLNRHPHIHLSVTRGGLCLKHGVWRPIYFKKKVVEAYWRQAVIKLLRESYTELDLSDANYAHIRDYRELCQFLDG